jgi:hypothetical protein
VNPCARNGCPSRKPKCKLLKVLVRPRGRFSNFSAESHDPISAQGCSSMITVSVIALFLWLPVWAQGLDQTH